MPAKQPKQSAGDEGALQVHRTESRTHNQRGESRQILSAEEAKLTVGRRSYVVDVVNLSGGGAMISTNVPLKLWQRVHLELGESGTVECAVVWLKGDRIGLEFAHETQIDADPARRDALLLETIDRNFPDVEKEYASETGRSATQRRGDSRHPLIWSGEIHYDYESTCVRLRNISDTGAMVESIKAFPEGAEVLLDLGGAGQHFAFVSWCRGDQVGLKFQHKFDIACLAHARPEVVPHHWKQPDFLNPQQEQEGWQQLSLSDLRSQLEGFLKR